ncbi:PREDICTED: uncharacterized protein LOC108779763, partial [Cyphomyrmex costatus]|uniref:uncharacterized protein LOC108779763 n=1 Tax=Cyphomyrmex costatus TaxID=456900 RepID=UPI0008523C32
MAKKNNVVLLSFPPHCSHKLQPLDVGVYGPFKNYYASQQDAWLRNHPGKTMTIHDIPSIVNKALPLALKPTNIINGFQKTGIAPFNKDIFSDDDFLSAFVTDRALDGTASSNIENTPVTTENTPIHFAKTQSPPTQTASLNDTTSPILEFTEDNIEVGAVEECESSVCANPVAGSSRDLIHDESTFAPEIIRPYPKAAARTKKITRKTRKSAILTDTPEKEALAVEQSKKKENTSKKIKVTKKRKAENTNKREESAKKKRKISVKRKVLQKSDEDSVEDDHFCLICCESFDQSRAGEKWVQ